MNATADPSTPVAAATFAQDDTASSIGSCLRPERIGFGDPGGHFLEQEFQRAQHSLRGVAVGGAEVNLELGRGLGRFHIDEFFLFAVEEQDLFSQGRNRNVCGIEDLLTEWHFDNLAKVVLLTSLVVSYAYITEAFMTWYAGDPIEQMTFHMRYFGPWGWMYWVMVLCNCVIPLLLFSPRIRVNLRALWVITIFVNIGMWFERFVIIAGSLTANFEPSQWASYRPSITEIMITVGSFAWFLGLFSLFCRFLPIFSMTELKEGIVWLRKALKMDRVTAA